MNKFNKDFSNILTKNTTRKFLFFKFFYPFLSQYAIFLKTGFSAEIPISHDKIECMYNSVHSLKSIQICSTWGCVGDGCDNKISIKYRPPAIQEGEYYTDNRLYLANQEMKKLFNEDR